MIPPDAFPGLTQSNYHITSPRTRTYNCIAWAAGDMTAWWWPDADEVGYWPPRVSRQETIEAFVQAFETLGYEICRHGNVEADFEKVALYALHGRPTHAAKQLSTGRWSSKLGVEEDIEHDADALDGPAYGSIVATLRRPLK